MLVSPALPTMATSNAHHAIGGRLHQHQQAGKAQAFSRKSLVNEMAKLLKMTPKNLKKDLQKGESFVQIAKQKGITEKKMENELMTYIRKNMPYFLTHTQKHAGGKVKHPANTTNVGQSVYQNSQPPVPLTPPSTTTSASATAS